MDSRPERPQPVNTERAVPPSSRSRSRVPVSHVLLFWALALAGASFDLGTKAWAFEHVGPEGSPSRPLIGNVVELRTVHNNGALWGIGSELGYGSLLFAVRRSAAPVVICYWLFVAGHARDLGHTAALGLIMAGAIGNCHDRLKFGYVRDFIWVHVDSIGFNFPVFNFADNLLVLGASWLMILAFQPDPGEPARVQSAEAADAGTAGST